MELLILLLIILVALLILGIVIKGLAALIRFIFSRNGLATILAIAGAILVIKAVSL